MSGIGEGSALADLSAAGLLDMPSGEWILIAIRILVNCAL
jgi:hypothetical protein